MHKTLHLVSISLAAFVALCLLSGCGGGSAPGGTVRVAYMSNGVDPFWDVAAAGARAAEKEFGVEVEVVFPSPGTIDVQRQKVQDLLVRGIDGLAISPIDGTNMTPFLDEVAGRVKLITHDSDAPSSKRLCFIGVDNYAAGRACGKLLREALPNGGQVALFVGRLEQDNARKRRQGVIDELLGRPADPTRNDAADASLAGNGFTIVATRTDDFVATQAKSNAEDILVKYPDLAGMVGLFAYNAPACLEALRGAGRVGGVKVASFDEQDATLDAIAAGEVVGTVSQNPYQYGYHSVRILAALCRGDSSVLPAGGVLGTDPTVVTQANLAQVRADLDAAVASGKR
ncbi:MAG: sugar-binding protein [Planctomycetota bacterium]